jgi:hypothetical protein
LDLVANLRTHGHPCADYEWNFHGRKKRRSLKGESADTLKLCLKCFLYHEGAKCPHCGHQNDPKQQKRFEEIDGRLVEIKGPVPLKKRPIKEQQSIEGRRRYALANSDLKTLLDIAVECGEKPMMVYWQLNKGRRSVNVTMLHEIRKQMGYKNGWVFFQKKEVEKRLGRK